MSIERRPVSISLDQFLAESLSIVETAEKNGVILRILGGFAIYIHSDKSPECRELQLGLDRLGQGEPPFTDLDLVGYNKQWKELVSVLEKSCKLRPDRMANALFARTRLIYFHPTSKFPIDVFLDKLEYSHDVVFGEYPNNPRLGLDYPTISLADLMLEKLQIHQVNRKDLIDLIVLLLGHKIVTEPDKDAIDSKHIASSLANDWGFYYDATNNLNSVKQLCETLLSERRITPGQSAIVTQRTNELLEIIDKEPKTAEWNLRAKIGPKNQWYREVTDL
ncbi:MAG TPA: hypothetical protein VJZ32_11305 [Candidatus Bathyarchaeia archaeon]|nr:hypothetical protein [Candidatus Bathyarchaeia archaeon]